ncbi:SMI1/KNR4 family protein [Agreia bicolorata]|uniref:SMI1/KNR4 family protein n=1 Tax=Agreia bicolorata TaxID=110935 RepID=UPI0006963EAE|nr:SMI1/KNR4 family protein [Agreia bicolorata]
MNNELKAALATRRNVESGTGATEEEIVAVEASIGLISPEYRQFLLDMGWLNVGHYEILGIGKGITPANDLLEVTLDERGYDRIPTLIPVMNNGAGDLYCVKEGSTSSPLLLSTLDSSPDYVVDEEGFINWLLNLVKTLPST